MAIPHIVSLVCLEKRKISGRYWQRSQTGSQSMATNYRH